DLRRPVTLTQFEAKVREVHHAIPKLTDGQAVLEFMKLMVFLEDGHTAVWNVGENPLFRAALPLRFFWFEEGLFVIVAEPKYKELLGARVQAFDGRTTDEVLKGMSPYVQRDRGNPMSLKMFLPDGIRKLAVLHAAGLIKRPDQVTLTVRDQSGATRDVD